MRIPYVPNTLLLLLVVLGGTTALAFRSGYVPARYSPFAALNLADPSSWFVDWRLAELGTDRALCTRSLSPPLVASSMVRDNPLRDGCGWVNAVRLNAVAGARLRIRVSCPMGGGLTMWVAHVVQPAARRHLNTSVTGVNHVGGYSCRNIRGGIGRYVKWKSEHSTANAIDITSFKLANGQRVVISRHWKGRGGKSRFLHDIHDGACRYFRVALGPDANALHHDHFHFDRGFLSACR